MGRVFSVDLDDRTMESLDEIRGMYPIKSRNGVIRHIINTYLDELDNRGLQNQIDALKRQITLLREEVGK